MYFGLTIKNEQTLLSAINIVNIASKANNITELGSLCYSFGYNIRDSMCIAPYVNNKTAFKWKSRLNIVCESSKDIFKYLGHMRSEIDLLDIKYLNVSIFRYNNNDIFRSNIKKADETYGRLLLNYLEMERGLIQKLKKLNILSREEEKNLFFNSKRNVIQQYPDLSRKYKNKVES